MSRKKHILLMTVGTNVGQQTNTDVARRLSTSIINTRPDFIVFFVTKSSVNIIEYLDEFIQDEYDGFEEESDYKLVYIDDIDDFNNCFDVYSAEFFKIYKQNKLIIDYHSGTKTMTAALACAGIIYNANLVTVAGYREDGLVRKGTESIRIQNIFRIKNEFLFYYVCVLFDFNRFNVAKQVANLLVSSDVDKEILHDFIGGYESWDSVKFNEAYDLLKKVPHDLELLEVINPTLKYNIKALGTIVNSHHKNLKNYYILASLINNAMRRAEEYKFDDAIARLYRSLELIAQIKLSQYNIKSSNVDLDILKDKGISEEFIEELIKYEDEGKIKIGLVMDYTLLNELNDPLGNYFIENKSAILNITSKRNISILAHGLESQSKEDYDEFESLVLELMMKLDKDMKKFLKETTFPKFNLNLLN